jgi:hypothetical protein
MSVYNVTQQKNAYQALFQLYLRTAWVYCRVRSFGRGFRTSISGPMASQSWDRTLVHAVCHTAPKLFISRSRAFKRASQGRLPIALAPKTSAAEEHSSHSSC